MYCKGCGIEINEGNAFCPNCGTKVAAEPAVEETPVPETPAPQPAPQPQVQYIPVPAEPEIPAKYRPIGAWGYFGWNLLFSIPIVGFIFMVIFACGGCKNINLRNYSRSFFCALLIVVALVLLYILILVIIALVGGTAIGAASYSYGY